MFLFGLNGWLRLCRRFGVGCRLRLCFGFTRWPGLCRRFGVDCWLGLCWRFGLGGLVRVIGGRRLRGTSGDRLVDGVARARRAHARDIVVPDQRRYALVRIV
ncbi:hypothetical protein ACQP2X_16185 [Actinoplanes sp. CA-131856]